VSLYNLGSALGELGSFKEMKEVLERSLDLTVRKFSATSPKTARVLLLLADAYDNLGMHDEQLKISKDAFEIVQRHCGKTHLQTTISEAAYALALGRCGDLPRCISLLQRTRDAQDQLLGPRHPQTSYTLYRLAWAYGCLKQHQRQKEHLMEALEAQKRSFGVRDHRNFDLFIAMAETCGELNQSDEYFDYSKAALKTAEDTVGPHHFKTARASFCCAKLYFANRSYNLALKFSSRAEEIFSKTFGEDHRETVLARELRQKTQKVIEEKAKEKEDHSS
jgi:tetratricopeptide (TPR) repeat protein